MNQRKEQIREMEIVWKNGRKKNNTKKNSIAYEEKKRQKDKNSRPECASDRIK